VGEHIRQDPAFAEAFARIRDLLLMLLPRYAAQGKPYVNIAFGCTGGRHRSVFTAERMARPCARPDFRPLSCTATWARARPTGSKGPQRRDDRTHDDRPIVRHASPRAQLTELFPHDRHDPGNPRPPGRGIRPRDGARRRPQDGIATVCIGPNDDMEQRREEIAAAIDAVDSGEAARSS
jgi:hypothetical protein